jgi:ubiquitin-conjugating enzyme E2 A
MSTAAKRRLIRDWKKLSETIPQGFNAVPLEDNILLWEAVIFGPEQSIWEGGVFKLLLEFTEEYPSKPPNIVFKTKLFHPNVFIIFYI